MRLCAEFKMSGWLSRAHAEPEPLDLVLQASADVRTLLSRELAIAGTLTAPGLAERASAFGKLAPRQLLVHFASDQAEALLLRATSNSFREAPLLSLSVFSGRIETSTGEPRYDVELRFDFRHDIPELFRSLRIDATMRK